MKAEEIEVGQTYMTRVGTDKHYTNVRVLEIADGVEGRKLFRVLNLFTGREITIKGEAKILVPTAFDTPMSTKNRS